MPSLFLNCEKIPLSAVESLQRNILPHLRIWEKLQTCSQPSWFLNHVQYYKACQLIAGQRVCWVERRDVKVQRNNTKRTRPTLLLLFIFVLLSVAMGQEVDEEVRQPRTRRSDKEALLEIQEKLGLHEILLWDNATDPCRDRWKFTACDCEDFSESFPIHLASCDNYTRSGRWSRIIYLELGSGVDEDFSVTGALPAALGRLTKLRMLLLAGNEFNGSIPDSWSALTELRFLSLANNQLTGPLPPFFANYTELKTLSLNGNNFERDIPEEWCGEKKLFRGEHRNDTVFTIHDNPQLCGLVPPCLNWHLNSLESTWLYSNSTKFENKTDYGVCDKSPPTCEDHPYPCRIAVPETWTNPQEITFNFTEFVDKDSGIAYYTFAIMRVENSTSNDTFMVTEEISRRYNDTTTLADNTTITTHWIFVNLTSILIERGFQDGQEYLVNLTAVNRAGPPLNRTIESRTVKVDFTAPVIGQLFNTPRPETQAHIEYGEEIGVSWDDISDPHTNITLIVVVLEIKSGADEISGQEHFEFVDVQNTTNEKMNKMTFNRTVVQKGNTYRFNVTATNGVGLTTTSVSSAFLVQEKSEELIAGMKSGSFVATVVIVVFMLCVGTYCFISIKRKHGMAERFNAHSFLKNYVYDLMAYKEDEETPKQMEIKDGVDFALVITDIENSTAQSDSSDHFYKELIQIHNKTIRDVLHRCGGLEVSTEGDSFIISFSAINHAVSFAIEVQEALLQYKWPKEILRLPGCGQVKNFAGELTFAGVRVRIGIHWVNSGSITIRRQEQSRAPVLAGSALELTKAVSDAGNGGQILLTHQAWMKMYPILPQCRFPTLLHLGFYARKTKDDISEQLPVYSITEKLGTSVVRCFPQIRRLEKLRNGLGYNIIPCPTEKEPDGTLTFVATRLHPQESLPSNLADLVYESISARVQLFQGFILFAEKRRVRYLIVFTKPLDAVRFTHVAQLCLVLTQWPSEISKLCAQQFSPGTMVPIFNGPRIAMAIHTTDDFKMDTNSGIPPNNSGTCWMAGPGITLVRHLADACDGGQIVLSEKTWQMTQYTLPESSQVISLGKHLVSQAHSEHMLLVEVNPEILKGRKFREIRTIEQSEPGYYDSPSIQNPIAVVFVAANKPRQVIAVEREFDSDVSNTSLGKRPGILNMFAGALETYTDLLRKTLHVFGGYECKQLRLGKFLIVFENLKDAVLWACYFQSELMEADWPEELLAMDECSVQTCDITKRVLRRGLGTRIGIAYGRVALRAPTKSGQADYFGMVVNLASRVLSIASPGQILIQPGDGFSNRIKWIREGVVGILSYPATRNGSKMPELAVEIVCAGSFLAEGLTEVTSVYQAQVSSLAVREMSTKEDWRTDVLESKRTRCCRNRLWPRVISLFKEAVLQAQYSMTEWSTTKRKSQRFYPSYQHSISDLNGALRRPHRIPEGFSPHASSKSYSLYDYSNEFSDVHPPHFRSQTAASGSGTTSLADNNV